MELIFDRGLPVPGRRTTECIIAPRMEIVNQTHGGGRNEWVSHEHPITPHPTQ